jgi:hypothetical protein
MKIRYLATDGFRYSTTTYSIMKDVPSISSYLHLLRLESNLVVNDVVGCGTHCALKIMYRYIVSKEYKKYRRKKIPV